MVRWSPVGKDGDPIYDDPATQGPAWMWDGYGSPAAALIQPASLGGPSTTCGIDVERAGLQDGSMIVVLRPADPTAVHGSVDVVAAYAHLDRWLRWSDNSACSW